MNAAKLTGRLRDDLQIVLNGFSAGGVAYTHKKCLVQGNFCIHYACFQKNQAICSDKLGQEFPQKP
jgi:hypothetical protein